MDSSSSSKPVDEDAFFTSPLSPPSEFLAPCPKFRILVLGNPESTKQEIFSKVFGVDLEKKPLADAFSSASPHHPITQELDLLNQNEHLTVFTSLNFGTGDTAAYNSACDFIGSHTSQPDTNKNIHCIWYCVAAEEQRAVHPLETQFFKTLATIAPHIPVVLLFTKYDEFVSQVQLDWSRDAQERGLSKVAVTHILRDLATKRFEKEIGSRWDEALRLGGSWQQHYLHRVCVASDGGEDGDGEESFERLARVTLVGLREPSVKLAYAVAQRNSALISTQFTATLASTFFTVSTSHARKLPGLEIRDILPNFFAKATSIFNMRDVPSLLSSPTLPTRILTAAFEGTPQQPLLTEILTHASTESFSLLTNNLSPHERAVLLVQCLAEMTLFLHKLAEAQWPHRENFAGSLPPLTLTEHVLERGLDEFAAGRERIEVLEMVEGSRVFTECAMLREVADLVMGVVERAVREGRERDVVAGGAGEYSYSFGGGHGGDAHGERHYGYVSGGGGKQRSIVVVDDSDLQEISLSFVNDKSPDDVVLPCGLKILPLN